jgi:hypothetical protein
LIYWLTRPAGKPTAVTTLRCVAPLWRVTSGSRPRGNQEGLPHASGSRCARLDSLRSPFGPACGCYSATLRLLTESLFQRPGPKGHPWPVGPFAASMRLNLLRKKSVRPPERGAALARMDKYAAVAYWRLICQSVRRSSIDQTTRSK